MNKFIIPGLLFILACNMSQEGTDSYQIAYNVWEDTANDNYDIYIMNMDGSGKKNITNAPGVEWVYYAYMNRIFFISDRDTCSRCFFLYEMDADGKGVRKISDLQLEDSWMSSRNNGKELVVTGRRGAEIRGQLFILNTEDGSWKQITFDTSARYNDPLFLPGGERIVFRYKPDKRDRNQKAELYIMNVDGGGMRQLTHYPSSDTTAPWYVYHAGPPRWSSIENMITYQSLRDSNYHLYSVSPEGKESGRLTSHFLNEGWHDWSPDGKWLALEMFDREQKEFDVYLMNWETRELKRLTDSWKYEQAPVFVRAE